MRIGITGTPGTGKTTIARKIAKNKNYALISLTEFVKKKKLWTEYDEERDTYVIDEDRVYEEIITLLEKIKDNFIVEGHFLDLIPKKFFDIVFVFRTQIKELRQRLEERHYSGKKIEENIEAEIMEVCLTDALYEYGPENVIVIDTSKPIEEVLKEIEQIICQKT